MFHRPALVAARGLAASVLFLTPLALAQDASSLFHEAYWLEHEGGDLAHALELYSKVAASEGADASLRKQAAHHATGIRESLAAQDMATLVPSDVIAFAQVEGPGDQLALLLDQVGLLGEPGHAPTSGVSVSPLLIDHLIGLRGAAVAITELRPGEEPAGFAILHPGGNDGLQGFFDTVLPAGGIPIDAIGGHPAWNVEGEVFVCRTSRLVIASRELPHLQAVVDRLHGDVVDSLAGDPRFERALGAEGDALLGFYVNADPLKPMIRQMVMQQAQGDPMAMVALNMMDLDSLESLSGRLAIDTEGLGLDLSLDLAAGHRNLVFNLMRRPLVGRETMELVPAGAAFFAASASNPEAGVAPIVRDSKDQPVVTSLDFGRELFGNIVDMALYGMPGEEGRGLPDAALVVRVNDVERSRALWEMLLETVAQATGGSVSDGEPVDGIEVATYALQGIPVHFAGAGDRLVMSVNRASLARSLDASGATALDDTVYGRSTDMLADSPTMLVALSPGRLAEMALAWAPEREAQQMAPFVDLLASTSVTLATKHSETRAGLSLRIQDLPEIGWLVEQIMAAQRGGGASYGGSRNDGVVRARSAAVPLEVAAVAEPIAVPEPEPAPEPVAAPVTMSIEELSESFLDVARTGDVKGAGKLAEVLVATCEDAKHLNNLAWALLTEDRFEAQHDVSARLISLRSNELADYSNWYYLDTLALAEFRTGDAERAVELQTKAIGHAAADGHHPELEESLRRYREAQDDDPIVMLGGSAAQ